MTDSASGVREFEDADRFSSTKLEGIARRILIGAGTSEAIAGEVSGLLAWSERIGHPSHGLLRLRPYVERIRDGRLVPNATASIAKETAGMALLDGHWGFGQVTAREAVDAAVGKARSEGVAVTGAYNINHIGRLGDFTEMCARQGLVAILMVGGAPTGMTGNVAPFGGRAPIWGTNPIAIAVPAGEEIFSLDFATSEIAGGKAAAARARGEFLEGDFLIDTAGRPSSDPEELEKGGAIRPFGGHKGYALAFAVELLAGAMVGSLAPDIDPGKLHNGLLLVAIDPGALGDAERFQASALTIIDAVRTSPPAEGFTEVLVPGDPESRRRAISDESGIFVPPALREDLSLLGSELGVDISW